MPNRETNPFHGLPLAQLYVACQQRARTLLESGVERTPEERANLAKDTAYLLMAVAPALAHGEHIPGSAEKALAQGTDDFMPAFLTVHEVELRQVRYRTLVAAADLACGGKGHDWCRDGTIDGHRVYELAMGSEQGLAQVLGELEQIYREKQGSPRRQ
jgi:hypothetical protein